MALPDLRIARWLCAIAISLVSVFAFASAASAAVVGPSGSAFYTVPSSLPAGDHGTLIQYRAKTLDLNVQLPSYQAWDVMYESQAQLGTPNVVTGTVIVPTAPWTGSGQRPVIDYAFGTQGLGKSCAPSKQMDAGVGTEYDAGAIIAALKAGYAVVATDYDGYTNDILWSEYVAGKAMAHAILDIDRAAREIPGSGIAASNPTIVWGYSQGGSGSSWTAQQQPSYAPEINLKGAAMGGTLADLDAANAYGDGSGASGFAFMAPAGFTIAYPGQFDTVSILNSNGLSVFAQVLHLCAVDALKQFAGLQSSTLTTTGQSTAQIIAGEPVLQQQVADQFLGNDPSSVPTYHYHGLRDEFVPVLQDIALHHRWCALGVKDDFQLYPGDHLLTDPTAIPDVMKWIADRLAGKPAPSTCGQHSPSQTPANAKTTSDSQLIVQIPKWNVSGSVTSAKLGLPINIPNGTTLDATTNLSTGTLTANLAIPPIRQTMSLLGIPVTIAAKLTPTGPINGTADFSSSGVLSFNATGKANLTVQSFSIGLITLPVNCTTGSPISMPLNASSSANALSVGALTTSATVTVPNFKGCLLAPVMNLLLAGPGNQLSLSASPPPPTPW